MPGPYLWGQTRISDSHRHADTRFQELVMDVLTEMEQYDTLNSISFYGKRLAETALAQHKNAAHLPAAHPPPHPQPQLDQPHIITWAPSNSAAAGPSGLQQHPPRPSLPSAPPVPSASDVSGVDLATGAGSGADEVRGG